MILTIKIIALSILVSGVVIASISDYRTLTISNRLTFFMFISGLALGTVFYLNVDIFCLAYYYLSVLLVFIFVYVLWTLGLWAGGDVKLLTAMSTLLCVDYLDILPTFSLYGYVFPYYGGTVFIPTVSVIVNSVLSVVPIIVIIILYEIIKNKPHLMKDIFTTDDLINVATALNIFGIYFIINNTFHIDNIMVNIALLLFVSYAVNAISKRLKHIVIPLSVIIIILNVIHNSISLYLMETIIITGIVLIKNVLKNDLLKQVLSHKVAIDELSESMILSYSLVKFNEEYFFDKRGMKERFVERDDYEVVIAQKARGLTDKDIDLLKRLYDENRIDDEVLIKHSVAFAPFILCGLIVTLTVGNTYLVIRDLLGVII